MARIHRSPTPLVRSQVEAALALFESLPAWSTTDQALRELRERFPESTPTSELLKVTAVNALYFTNIYAVARMAEHVHDVLNASDLPSADEELVERLALLPSQDVGGKARNNLSFASKYAHFFIDGARFPILDQYALAMLRIHLGRSGALDAKCAYVEFVADFRELQRTVGWDGDPRALDRYLWLAGLRMVWRGGREDINREVLDLFRSPTPLQQRHLSALDGSVAT